MANSDLPFPNLNISDFGFLNDITEKHNCSKCGKRRMYFCYTCFLPLDQVADKLPRLKLPLKVYIIKHPGEVCGKSTAVHAAILAPEDVNIHVYPDIPEFDPLKTALLYPCDESHSFKDYLTNNSIDDSPMIGSLKMAIDGVIFIDSTWFQAYKIFSDPRLKEIPRLDINSHDTKFWRYQLDKPATYLSTIEAIYYCIKEYDEIMKQNQNNKTKHNTVEGSQETKHLNDDYILQTGSNNFDDLLLFFSFFYTKIRKIALEEGRTLKSYTNQRIGKKKDNK